MNIASITESRWEARHKYAEYLRAVKQRHTDEYEALKNAYRELSRGRQVIDLIDVLRTAGTDAAWRPKLAIIRADAKVCWFRWSHDLRGRRPGPTFSATDCFFSNPRSKKRIILPASTWTRPAFRSSAFERKIRAVVPSIPPSIFPKGRLDRYFILWEAEWETLPVDPLLLRPLGKHLYVVLAKWDLTPLERAILSERL